MAPITQLLKRAPKSYSHPSHSGGGVDGGDGGSGGAIAGGVVAVIIAIIIITFLVVFYLEYRKASRLRTQTGKPIRYGRIFGKAALISLTFGVAACCCAECFADSDGPVTGGGGGGGSEPVQMMDGGGGGGFVTQPPVPTGQPQMNWAPVQGAAQDGVQ